MSQKKNERPVEYRYYKQLMEKAERSFKQMSTAAAVMVATILTRSAFGPEASTAFVVAICAFIGVVMGVRGYALRRKARAVNPHRNTEFAVSEDSE